MRAEGLGVANLLQMGTADQFDVTPQVAFGDAGVYGGGETRLFAGQEVSQVVARRLARDEPASAEGARSEA
jgi:hypothetical protein